VKEVWQELEVLAAEEQVEVQEIRPFRPDWKSMITLNESGIFRVLVARVNGEMIGYFSWLLDFDLESRGTLIANQSTWYVKPRHAVVAVRMLDMALEEIRKAGVEFTYLHHTVTGRGSNLGRLFERRGAELLGYNYVLRMKEKRV